MPNRDVGARQTTSPEDGLSRRPSGGILRSLALGIPRVRRTAANVMRRPSLWSAFVLILLIIAFSVASSNFISQAAWLAIALTASTTLLLAFGEVFVIIGGGIDISFAGVIGVTGIAGGLTMGHFADRGVSPTIAILLGLVVMLAIGTFIGLVNGLVVTRLKVNPFIATLAMSSAALGTGELINSGADVNNVPAAILNIGDTNVLGGWIPLPMLIAAAIGVLAAALLHLTRFGRWTYLIGSNMAASRRAGIPVERHLVKLYVLSGAFASIASFLIVARLGLATPGAGTGDELLAVATCVIGGASLAGGRGSIPGTVMGAGIVTVLEIGLIIAGVQSFWQLVATGVLLVGAVWADQQRIRVRNSAIGPADVVPTLGTAFEDLQLVESTEQPSIDPSAAKRR
jgi:ribose transport system permease protein